LKGQGQIKWCLASNNQHKIEELQQILGKSILLQTMAEMGCLDDIPETGLTIEENSEIKARYIFERYKIPVIADDSGLEILALEGRPGVYSARYAGEHGNHAANMAKVLLELDQVTERSAQFKTVLTLIQEDGQSHQFLGIVRGHINLEPKGTGGFGYDPIFVPEDYSETFAELSAEIKNQFSHRRRASDALRKYLQSEVTGFKY
jgi:XTP/dITP diphosphohydrolase